MTRLGNKMADSAEASLSSDAAGKAGGEHSTDVVGTHVN